MVYSKRLKQISAFIFAVILSSCSTIDSTIDSTWDSISSAGEYVYDTIAVWEDDDEPEQSEAVVIEEAVEVPEYAMPPEYGMPEEDFQNIEQEPIQPPVMPSGVTNNFYYDPIYRSARQYYYVGPNGTPFKAPPPPPFPQYSIDQQNSQVPYSYYQNQPMPNFPPQQSIPVPQQSNNPEGLNITPESRVPMSKEEEMELFGIQNDCIRVKEDYVNGGYQCDDFD